jgi:hypothetical protein
MAYANNFAGDIRLRAEYYMVKNFTATILKGHAHSLLLTDSDRIHS